MNSIVFVSLSTVLLLTACNPKQNSELQIQNSPAIFGGEVLNPDEEIAGYIVGIYHPEEGYICTGTLIEENIVLTAAHCIKGDEKKIVVFFGSELQGEVVGRRVIKAVVHPRYRPHRTFSTADVAILQFSGSTPDGFSPLEMLSDPSELKAGTEILMAGYGLSDTVEQTGSGVLRWVLGQVHQDLWSKSEATVMQSLKTGGVCSGDSGGPAMALVNDRWVVWGVTSRGLTTGEGICVNETYFTRVDKYEQWIAETIQHLFAGQ
jgi:secreted trypsin-like serine protease